MPGDLHTHTTFSDGSTPADKLPFLAACAGMTHLAISDHDSIRSVRYAYAHPVQNGVHLIPATELTAYDYERAHRVHLLCYWPDDCPALEDFSRMMGISTPNAAYKIGSLVKKGYVEKIQSTTDRREYFLRPTQKYIDYYSISYSYLHTVIERVRKRFPAEDCDKMEQMLSVISTELMPELDMLAKCRHPEAPAEDTTH